MAQRADLPLCLTLPVLNRLLCLYRRSSGRPVTAILLAPVRVLLVICSLDMWISMLAMHREMGPRGFPILIYPPWAFKPKKGRTAKEGRIRAATRVENVKSR